METDIRQQRIKRSKRRERAQRMHAKKHELDSGEEDEVSAKEKAQRPPPPSRRKKKTAETAAMFDEDVVDGFAILSFKTYDDLEVSTVCCLPTPWGLVSIDTHTFVVFSILSSVGLMVGVQAVICRAHVE